MCPTDLTSLTSSFETNYGSWVPETVLQTDTLEVDWRDSTPGWNGFDLDPAYSFDGGSGLIVEFRYMGSTPTTVNVRAASLQSDDRCLDGPLPTSSTGDLMGFLTSMRIHYTQMGTGGVQDEGSLSLSVAENPVRGNLTALVSSREPAEASLTIYGMDGRLAKVLWRGQLNGEEMALNESVRGLSPGVYTVVLSCPEGALVQRVVLLGR